MRIDRLAKTDARQRRALQRLAKSGTATRTPVNDGSFDGSIDGSNPSFTLPQIPAAGTLKVFKNGLLQKPGASYDYTLSAATITFNAGNIPQSGDNIMVFYETE